MTTKNVYVKFQFKLVDKIYVTNWAKMVGVLGFNVPATAEVIQRRDLEVSTGQFDSYLMTGFAHF